MLAEVALVTLLITRRRRTSGTTGVLRRAIMGVLSRTGILLRLLYEA
jgi:hypothetical protein